MLDDAEPKPAGVDDVRNWFGYERTARGERQWEEDWSALSITEQTDLRIAIGEMLREEALQQPRMVSPAEAERDLAMLFVSGSAPASTGEFGHEVSEGCSGNHEEEVAAEEK